MDQHSPQFLFVSDAIIFGIVRYPLGTDKDVAGDHGRRLHGKGDDVGQRIVLEMLHIDLMEVVVVTEDVVESGKRTVAGNNDTLDPSNQSCLIENGNFLATRFGKKINGRLLFFFGSRKKRFQAVHGLLELELHLYFGAVFGVLYFIAEFFDQEDTTTAAFTDLLGTSGIRDFFGIKSFALIFDADTKAVTAFAHFDVDGLTLVHAVAVNNGIIDGLSEADQQIGVGFLVESVLLTHTVH